jgi:hypothetical protein
MQQILHRALVVWAVDDVSTSNEVHIMLLSFLTSADRMQVISLPLVAYVDHASCQITGDAEP